MATRAESKKQRAPYGAGTVIERAPNRWQLRVSVGMDPITGKHRRATKTVHATSKKQALAELATFAAGGRHGTKGGATLLGLFEEYLEASTEMSAGTRQDYEGYFHRYVPDQLQRRRLRDLSTRDLDALYSHLRRRGSRTGGELAASTVDRLHTILHAALEQGVKWKYITENPAADTRSYAQDAEEVELPPADDLIRLLAALDDLTLDAPSNVGRRTAPDGRLQPRRPDDPSPLPDFVAVLLGTGARPGEVCALPWGDVNLDPALVDDSGSRYGILTIDQNLARRKGGTTLKKTKTSKGRRVTIDASLVAVLEQRRARWRPDVLASGYSIADFPVFPSPTPSPAAETRVPWRPDSISREFRRIRDDLDLSDTLTLRNLRHYCTSVLVAAGIDVVTAARRQGHSPTIMLKVYAHLTGGTDHVAAAALADNLAKLKQSS